MRTRTLSRRQRPLVWLVLASFLLQPVLSVASAEASVRLEDADSVGRARAIAPLDGERLPAGEAQFAAELPTDISEAWIVAAAEPFDAARWTALPTGSAFKRADVTRGLVPLSALDLGIARPTQVWWTVATVSKTTGLLKTSPVRSFTALPRFTNRIAPSPYLLESRRGLLGAADKGGASVDAGAPPRIRLTSGFDFAPSTDGAPQVATLGVSARVAPVDPAGEGDPHAYLVQFASPPSDAERADLARAGGVVVAYVPDQAYLVRMTPSDRVKYEAEGHALWIGDFQPAFKMSPMLADASIPVTGQYMALVFPDADVRATAAALGKLGATVEATNDNGVNKLLRFRAPAGGLLDVAALSEVAWVEPVAVKTVSNVNAAWVVQTNNSLDYRIWNMGLRGLGQVVNTTDSGIDVTHNMFRDPLVPITDFGDYPTHRKIIAYKKGSTNSAVEFGDHGGANSYHGSHTGCSMVGNDSVTAGISTLDGMAKDAKIYFMDLSGTTLANSVVPFDDLNDLYTPPYTGNGGGAARISSNSWGSAVNGLYDLNAMQVDQFVWNHPDFYIAFSNGNSGPTTGSVGSPASAKNLAGMGGVRNGPNQGLIYSPTSRGPTQDGRRKPLFCAPGQTVMSAQNGPANYASLSGTSMACPTGTGAVTLMRQYLCDGWYPTGAPVVANAFSPSAALLKAMAVNAADNGVSGGTAPDNNIGYGRIKIDNVLFFPGDARKLLLVDNTEGLGQGQYIEYQVNVTETTQPLEVSLCWSDYPGNPAAAVQLVNNLNLSVTNGAQTYLGNVFSAGVSVTGGVADAVNVEENVLVSVPTAGLYTIRVAAPAIPVGPQPFGLCVTGGVGQNAGALALDRAEYGSTSTVDLQVTDTNAGPTVNVTVTSNTEPAGEVVTLTGGNGVFSGSLQLGFQASTPSNGTLSVSNGDALTATYNDASPAATLIANATVSYATPAITNVKATSQGTSGTLVTYNTDINATGKVYYGLTPALELGSVPETGARLAHSILLTGLTAGSTYYYDVDATALNGNVARDNLGGSHYKFTAKGSGDILLVVGEASYPRLTTWQSMLAADNYDYDLWNGPLADHPVLGDLNSGLRSYKAVLWQVGIDEYPPFSDEQRTVVTDYMNGGGRLATFGHDIGWALGDLTSGFATGATQAWLAGTLKTVFNADPTTWNFNFGVAADPISGAYAGGVNYEPVRAGGAGDEVDIAPSPGGPASYDWRNNDATPDDIGLRWESAVPNGTAGTAVWGGQTSRLANQFYELTAMDPPFTSPSTIRNDIADKILLWLFGRSRPAVAVTSPNGGETLTTNSAPISWNETIGGGFNAAARTIEYSLDGGDSWTTLTTSAGASPYSWDLTTVPNSAQCLVRVKVTDDGVPGLAQADRSNATFAINRAGGDVLGPVVVAGSIAVSPNPIVRPNPFALTATVSDAARGGSNIAAAEWSFGPQPSQAGLGAALTLGGAGSTVGVSGTLDSSPLSSGPRTIWVRAQDVAGNWGPASSLAVQVNGLQSVDVSDVPKVAFLAQNAPNPFAGPTSMRFGLTASGPADLSVFSVQGRLVKHLVSGVQPAGVHVATWDGRDESGRRAAAGIYYYLLVTQEGRFEKRMVALP